MSGVVYANLMCHAPIVIPEIAGENFSQCLNSTQAMEDLSQDFMQRNCDLLILISPHTPRLEGSFGILLQNPHYGTFLSFGFPHISVNLPNDTYHALHLMEAAHRAGVSLKAINFIRQLDHGALVPLYFMQKAGWNKSTIIISLPGHSNFLQDDSPGSLEANKLDQRNAELGQLLRKYALHEKVRVGIIASGDMSHRLMEGAPAGFDPLAKTFDEQFIKNIQSGNFLKNSQIAKHLRDLAAEDVMDSFEIAASAINYQNKNSKLFSYEGPFGVGYGMARLYGE